MSEIRTISSSEELDEILSDSAVGPVWLLKHSLTCPISTSAWGRFREFAERSQARFALVEVQNSRPLTAEIAERTGIRHESPQAILFRNGTAVWHASHWDVEADAMGKAQAELGATSSS